MEGMNSSASETTWGWLSLHGIEVGRCAGGPGKVVYSDVQAGWMYVVEGRMVSGISIAGGLCEHTAKSPMLATPEKRVSERDGAADNSPADSIKQKEMKLDDSSSLLSIKNARSKGGHDEEDGGSHTDSSSCLSMDELDMAFLVPEGANITSVTTSLCCSWTSVQRHQSHVEILEHASRKVFVLYPSTPGSLVLTNFWIERGTFIMVTTCGFEMYVPDESCGFKLKEDFKQSQVQWSLWSFSTRILMLACGSIGCKLQGFQITSSAVNKLTLLDVSPPWGSPVKSSKGPHFAGLSRSQVFVFLCYERVFLARHDCRDGVIFLHRVYKDSMPLVATIDLGNYKEEVKIQVLENVIVIHQLAQKKFVLVDLAASTLWSRFVENREHHLHGANQKSKIDRGSFQLLNPRSILICKHLMEVQCIETASGRQHLDSITLMEGGIVYDSVTGCILKTTLVHSTVHGTPQNVEMSVCFLSHRDKFAEMDSKLLIERAIGAAIDNKFPLRRLYHIFISIYSFRVPLLAPNEVVRALESVVHVDALYRLGVMTELISACHELDVDLKMEEGLFRSFVEAQMTICPDNMVSRLKSFSSIFDSPKNASFLEDQCTSSVDAISDTYFKCCLSMKKRLNDPAGVCRLLLRKGLLLDALRLVDEYSLQGVIHRSDCLEATPADETSIKRFERVIEDVFQGDS